MNQASGGEMARGAPKESQSDSRKAVAMNGAGLTKTLLSALAAVVFAGGAGVLGWVVVELRALRTDQAHHERAVGHVGMTERSRRYEQDIRELKELARELRTDIRGLRQAVDDHNRRSR